MFSSSCVRLGRKIKHVNKMQVHNTLLDASSHELLLELYFFFKGISVSISINGNVFIAGPDPYNFLFIF